MLHLLNWPTSEEGFSNSNFSVWRIGLSAEGVVLVPKSVILLCWKRIPNFWQYVPLKHIASYLWITPQSLSRIRAGLGKQKKING